MTICCNNRHSIPVFGSAGAVVIADVVAVVDAVAIADAVPVEAVLDVVVTVENCMGSGGGIAPGRMTAVWLQT